MDLPPPPPSAPVPTEDENLPPPPPTAPIPTEDEIRHPAKSTAPPLILISTPSFDHIGANQKVINDALVTRVELTISAQSLLDRDAFSVSDPVCVVYTKENIPKKKEWIEVGRTEQIKNNLNPEWNTKFVMEYRFEERQILKFAIYDWDCKEDSLSMHDFLGQIECSLGEIVAAPNNKFMREMAIPPPYKKKSTITILAEELGENKMMLGLTLNCRNLDKKDVFGKSDPFVTISRKLDSGSWALIHKTEVIKKTLNPDWRYFSLRVSTLTSGGNLERTLRFQVHDWNNSGSNDFIGEFETSYADLTEKFKEGNNAAYELVHTDKLKRKKSYKNSGILNIVGMNYYHEKTFLDYIQEGVQLHFSVAIDFTASNGHPDKPTSLHYRRSIEDSQYSLAIRAVGEIIQDYNHGKMFPAFGFGAKIPPTNSTSHNFPLNGVRENPCCDGVDGILESYKKTLRIVTLHGPTYFTPNIKQASNFASLYQDGKNYFVLLIITDGIITDFDATKEAIIDASPFPLSIIIIGVGAEDFKEMEALDADGKLLKYGDKIAVRDIVQFVELRKFMSPHRPPRISDRSKASLGKSVLMELPGQVVHWMKTYGPDKPKNQAP